MLITLASETIIDKARHVAASVLRGELARLSLLPSEADDPQLVEFAMEQASDVDLYRYATTDGRDGRTAIDKHLHVAVLLRYRNAVAAALAQQFAPLELQPHHFQSLARDTLLQLPISEPWPTPSVLAAVIAAAGPFSRINPDGSRITAWCRNGKLHRDPNLGPAVTTLGPDFELTEYYVDGVLHRPRDQGPAVIEKRSDASFEVYYRDGVVHRPASEGPAEIIDMGPANGAWIAYRECGTMHRPAGDGPAYVFTGPRRATCGDILPESDQWEYRERGNLHRPASDGPAEVHFDLTNGALCMSYWENGEHLRTLTEVHPC